MSPDHDPARMREHVEAIRPCRLPGWLRDATDSGLVAAALTDRIDAVVPDATTVYRVRVEDARVKRRGWILRYTADIAAADGDGAVVLTAELRPPGSGWRPSPDDSAVWLPELGMAVRTLPADPGLPALPSLTDPAAARELLERVMRDSARPGLRLMDVQPRLARYKPGNRATLVYQLRYPDGADPTWPPTVVAKTYREDDGAATYAAMRALWESPLKDGRDVRLAEPLGYLPPERVLLQGPVTGDRTLSDALQLSVSAAGQVPPDLEGLLERTAAGLVALHGCGARSGPSRDVSAELNSVRQLLTRVAPSLPAAPVAAAESLLSDLAGWAAREPPMPPGPVHGAFRPAQVLLDGGSPGFIDFDGFGLGEAALDVGRFLARLGELWLTAGAPYSAGDLARQQELADAFVAGYVQRAPLPAARVAIWRSLDLAGGVVRSWSRAKSARAGVLLDLLHQSLRAQS